MCFIIVFDLFLRGIFISALETVLQKLQLSVYVEKTSTQKETYNQIIAKID